MVSSYLLSNRSRRRGVSKAASGSSHRLLGRPVHLAINARIIIVPHEGSRCINGTVCTWGPKTILCHPIYYYVLKVWIVRYILYTREQLIVKYITEKGSQLKRTAAVSINGGRSCSILGFLNFFFILKNYIQTEINTILWYNIFI